MPRFQPQTLHLWLIFPAKSTINHHEPPVNQSICSAIVLPYQQQSVYCPFALPCLHSKEAQAQTTTNNLFAHLDNQNESRGFPRFMHFSNHPIFVSKSLRLLLSKVPILVEPVPSVPFGFP